MKEILMTKGAIKLVETCAAVKPGENVLIITDFTKTSIAKVLAAAAYEKGAEVVIATMIPRKGHGEEPPATVAEAMIKAAILQGKVGDFLQGLKNRGEGGVIGHQAVDRRKYKIPCFDLSPEAGAKNFLRNGLSHQPSPKKMMVSQKVHLRRCAATLPR